jgi:hypothetical protein
LVPSDIPDIERVELPTWLTMATTDRLLAVIAAVVVTEKAVLADVTVELANTVGVPIGGASQNTALGV